MKKTFIFAVLIVLASFILSGCLKENPTKPEESDKPLPVTACEPGPVAFERLSAINGGCVIIQGFYSDTRENIVIRTQEEYTAFLAAHSHMLGAGIVAVEPLVIDFDKKILIAVFMGKFSQMCYSTSIESIERKCIQLCGTPPVMPGDAMPYIFVKIRETYPAPDAICLQAISWPAALVLIDKAENESANIYFEYL